LWVAVAKEGSAWRVWGGMLGEKAPAKVEVDSWMEVERCTDEGELGVEKRDLFMGTVVVLLLSGITLVR